MTAMRAFAKAAPPPEGTSGFGFIDAILHERPDLRGQMSCTPEQGYYAHTVFIGDEVFKGPRHPDYFEAFESEPRILKQLERKGLPVPKLTCEGKDFIFYGMTRLPGVALGEKFAPHFTLEEQRSLAKEVIDFVIKMAKAFPADEQGRFLMHNDLHCENILIDPATKKLTGIIDFGKVAYCDKYTWAPHENVRGYFADMLRKEFYARKSELPDPPQISQKLQP